MAKNFKIAIVGGSNSVQEHSYAWQLVKNHDASNFSIGATPSLHGLVSILTKNIIEDYDLVIFEYCLNDVLYAHSGRNRVNHVRNTLQYIIKKCSRHNTKLIFIICYDIKNFDSYINNVYFQLWKKIAENHQVLTIDTLDMLAEQCGMDSIDTFFKHDRYHLNEAGMQLLYNKVINTLKDATVPPRNNDATPWQFNLLKLKDHASTSVYQNSLLSRDVYKIENKLTIVFDKPTSILAIEYLFDKNTRYASICNEHGEVHKCLRYAYGFIKRTGKTICGLIRFNETNLRPGKQWTIQSISAGDVNPVLLDVTYKKGDERALIQKCDNMISPIQITSMLVPIDSRISKLIL